MGMRTTNMRVPVNFDAQVKKMTKKYKYKSQIKFLEGDGTIILENVDTINRYFKPIVGLFDRGKKSVKKKQ